jgi:hypothetical protein
LSVELLQRHGVAQRHKHASRRRARNHTIRQACGVERDGERLQLKVSWQLKYLTTKDLQQLSEKQPRWQRGSDGPLHPMTNQKMEDEILAHRSNAALRRSESDNVPAPSLASQEKANKESLTKALVAERIKKSTAIPVPPAAAAAALATTAA